MDKTLTVTELSILIKRKIEGSPDLTSIWVKGELSNITYHSSGHIYFTLKDQSSVIQAAFFKNVNRSLKFKLEEGLAVIVFGSVTIYEKRGNYQMIIAEVMLEGVGELQKRIEQLKKTLADEGIFESSRKRKLPFLPKRIGVVTSPTGAAYRDILKVALRRYPTIEIILAPAKVQGDDAALTIVRGIEELNNPKWNIDVIIAGRGGGSFEDLMPFNEEIVVRAFASSRIPIVSAVGHQIDHPLSDDAADAYAPTPSAAAELVVPVKADLVSEIDYYLARGDQALLKKIQNTRLKVEGILARRVFAEPGQIVYMKEIELSDFLNRMTFALKDRVSLARDSLARIPDINRVFSVYFISKKSSFAILSSSLQNLSPLAVMSRGFAVPIDSQKKVVKSVTQVNTGDGLSVFLSDGLIDCSVRSIKQGVSLGKEKESKED
jgi:exodeoxyribonuclease VII large subunit